MKPDFSKFTEDDKDWTWQLVEMRWSGEDMVDDDGYPLEPPYEGAGGWDHIISQRIMRPVNVYGCRYCGADVFFRNRLPQNMDDTPHRCLADAAKARRGIELEWK